MIRLRDALRWWPGSGSSPDDATSPLSPEEFQQELVILGLSGQTFTPKTYAAALGTYLGLIIDLHVFPDQHYPALSRQLARSGNMAELIYASDPPAVTILLPTTLPPLLLNLVAYHELGHLAAGHHLCYSRNDPLRDSEAARYHRPATKTLAHGAPSLGKEQREEEADLRAYFALVAGSLGADSPYAQEMYDIL